MIDTTQAVEVLAAKGEESDTSEIIASCLCKGRVLSRDCVMCEGPACIQANEERWFHAKCVGLSKREFSILSLS